MSKHKGPYVKAFRLAHQTLCITAFNFETKSLIGYVELLIYPLRPDLRRLKINSKQCCIYRVSINEMWDAAFSYNDPSIEICQGDIDDMDIDNFKKSYFNVMHSVDSQNGNGEITVKMPQETSLIIQEMKPFRLCIEFSLEQPKGGIKFVVPDIDGSMLDRGAHLFTYGHESSSRLWFPCIDCYQEVCTWKLEFSVDIYLTAISCGDLVETVYTPDLRKKTYHYYLATPTAAPNIALAVGPFEVYVDPNMHEVTHFCLPHLLPILRNATAFLHEAFEFYEELLSVRFPYSCYKQVFVDQAFGDMNSYATLTIFNTNILHSEAIIDQTPISRQIMSAAIAQQFFGCFISMDTWSDAWLTKGISGYLASQFRKSSFGNNEYRYWVAKDLHDVHTYERDVQTILLDKTPSTKLHTKCENYAHTQSPRYIEMFTKKSILVMRILESRLGRDLFLQVFNKMLSLAMIVSQQKFIQNTWFNMSLSTVAFVKSISTVTGKDVTDFLRQWVYESGCARFVCTFAFNRKRNIVELYLKQDMSTRGTLKFAGPLTVTIQELDGTFTHVFKIEEGKNKFEITCHSKSRRNKKKKIPLFTGIEVDMDLKDMDCDSPVLWLRIDPNILTLRQVRVEQPDVMWQYQLTYERDILAQLQAIEALGHYPSPATRLALTDAIENDKLFYRVRIAALECLAKVANQMVSTWVGPPAMINIFRKMFCSSSCNTIIKMNNFSNYQNYYIQKEIPKLMARLRTVHGICPPEVFQFILDLFKYNDNTQNKYSDNYYRAAIIDALALTVTPAVTTVTITGLGPSTDALTTDTRLILEEVTRYLNLENCINAIRKLQQFGHLPSDPTLFESYVRPDNFTDVRLAALTALIDYTKVENSIDMLLKLLEMAKDDPEPYVQHKILEYMKDALYDVESGSVLLSDHVKYQIWSMMNTHFKHDSRLRCDTMELFIALFSKTAFIPPESSKEIEVTPFGITKKSSAIFESKSSSQLVNASRSFTGSEPIPLNEDSRSQDGLIRGSIMEASPSDHMLSNVDQSNIDSIFMTDNNSQFSDSFKLGMHAVPSQNHVSVAALSEDSSSNSLPPMSSNYDNLPTSFTGSMFANNSSQEGTKKRKKKSRKHKKSTKLENLQHGGGGGGGGGGGATRGSSPEFEVI